MDVVNSGLLPAAAIAALAGLVSFASPCVLPLLPGFLGYVTGLSDLSLAERGRARLVLGATLFVVGFSAVFLIGTMLAASMGQVLIEHRLLLQRLGGVLVVIFGLMMLGLGAGSRLLRERKLPVTARSGLLGAPVVGAIFGLGWAPCTGPTLGAVLAMAASAGASTEGSGGLTRALILGASYCLGLGLPFIAFAAAYERFAPLSGWLREHSSTIQRAGGVLLIIMGVLLFTGTWGSVITWLQLNVTNNFKVPI